MRAAITPLGGISNDQMAWQEQGRWEVAANVYRRLIEVLPPMRAIAESRLQRVQQMLAQLNADRLNAEQSNAEQRNN